MQESDYPLPDEFDAVYEKAQKLVFEADASKFQDPEVAQAMMAQAMLTDSKTLPDVLNEDVYKKLGEEAAKLSIPIANLARFKPSMVMITMTSFKLQQIGISAKGVDQNYIDKANADSKEIGYLETAESQINALMNMGVGYENDFVMYSLEEMDQTASIIEELITSWKDGTSSVVKNQLTVMKKGYPDIYNSLILNRNNNRIPQLNEFMQDDTVEFVIVGSLHLHGPDGILGMLKAQGYQVTQFNR